MMSRLTLVGDRLCIIYQCDSNDSLNMVPCLSRGPGCGVGFGPDGTLGIGAGVRAGLGVGQAIPLVRLGGNLSLGLVLGPAVGMGQSLGYRLQQQTQATRAPHWRSPNPARAEEAERAFIAATEAASLTKTKK